MGGGEQNKPTTSHFPIKLKEVLVMVENKIDMSQLLFKEVFLLELPYGKLGILP